MIKKFLDFVQAHIDIGLDNYNPNTRAWSEGYRKAYEEMKQYIQQQTVQG